MQNATINPRAIRALITSNTIPEKELGMIIDRLTNDRDKDSLLEFTYSMLKGFSAVMIAESQGALFRVFNDTLGNYGKEEMGFTSDGYSKELRSILEPQIKALKYFELGTILLESTDPEVREILGF